MKSQSVNIQIYKYRILYGLILLPAAYFFSKGSSLMIQLISFCGMVFFVLAQYWIIKKKSTAALIVSMLSGAVYIQSIVLMTGGYTSPFIFIFVIPMITYGFTERYQWAYYTLLVYTPFMAYQLYLSVVDHSRSGVILVGSIWLLLILVALTVVRWDVYNKEQIYQLKEKVRRDPLTGLFNRYVLDEIYRLIESRNNEESCTIMMFDLDKFKQHNDLFGHPAGDKLLRKVSQVLMDNVRTNDIIIRYGGDEFLIILWGIETEKAENILLRICQRVLQETGCSISGGFATSAIITRQNFEELMNRADQDLYKRKEDKLSLCNVTYT